MVESQRMYVKDGIAFFENELKEMDFLETEAEKYVGTYSGPVLMNQEEKNTQVVVNEEKSIDVDEEKNIHAKNTHTGKPHGRGKF